MDTDKLKRIFSAFKDRKSLLLLLLGACGILLIFLSSFPKKEEVPAISEQTSSSYAELLASRLASFIGSMEGAGETKVLITLENSGEDRYLKAENTDVTKDTGVQKEGMSEEYVLVDGKDGRAAVLVSSFEPEIRGVAVICEGGDDAAVRARVTETVTTLLHISSARVSVSQMARS